MTTGSGDTNPTPGTREYLERVVDAYRERLEESVRCGEAEFAAMRSDVVKRAKAALDIYRPNATRDHDDRFIGFMRELVPELVAEIERLRTHVAAVPSAIQAYAEAELTSVSYESGEPGTTEAMKFALATERETLLRFQRNADDIVAYAATAVKS